MAVYKSTDILKVISEITSDGFKYVDVYELEGSSDEDGDAITSLNFEAVADEFSAVGYDSVYSCGDPTDSEIEAPESFHNDDFCGLVSFTFGEIFTINHAVNNALEYFKELSKDTSIPRETLEHIKSSSVSCRNLQAKLVKFLKDFNIS